MENDGHRCCIGMEHDPPNGKLHGYCIRCGIPWPCPAEEVWEQIRQTLLQAARMKLETATVEHSRC